MKRPPARSGVWAIVPVKPFVRSKSRLASVLSPDERAGLSRGFLEHALTVLNQVPAVLRVLVISRDPAALALARQYRAHTVTESGAPGLNAALRRATHVAAAFGATGVLVLPADLPLLAPNDVCQLVEHAEPGPLVCIAPDRHGLGTNALFVRPPGLIDYAFGDGSCARHLARAEHAGAAVCVRRLAGAALDVDVPEDWRLYQAGRLL
jgi:2-phospho-L-lactate/phosphoenolpyruvate guanylyltransferase